jgi:hypothetical protein
MFHFPGSLSSDQVAHLRNLVDSSNIGVRVYFFAASGFKYSDNRDIPRDFDARQQDAIYVMLEYWQDPREEQEQNGPGGAWLDEDGMEVALAEHLEKETRKIGCSKIVVKHVKFNTIDYLLEEVPEEAEGQDTTFNGIKRFAVHIARELRYPICVLHPIFFARSASKLRIGRSSSTTGKESTYSHHFGHSWVAINQLGHLSH